MDRHDFGLGFSVLSLLYEAEALYWAVPWLTTVALVFGIVSLLIFAATLLH